MSLRSILRDFLEKFSNSCYHPVFQKYRHSKKIDTALNRLLCHENNFVSMIYLLHSFCTSQTNSTFSNMMPAVQKPVKVDFSVIKNQFGIANILKILW